MNYTTSNLYVWEKDFCPIIVHTSLSYLKQSPDFLRAKSGDLESATKVVERCVKQVKLSETLKKFSDAVLLPVISKNRLPDALADKIGLDKSNSVHLISSIKRKNLPAMQRLLHRPYFTGEIVPGKKYLIIDDIVTQGGTIAALRRFVIKNGGKVCGITALAHSVCDGIISVKEENVVAFQTKFPELYNSKLLKSFFNVDDVREFTNPQMLYLLTFKNTQAIINKIYSCYKKNPELNYHSALRCFCEDYRQNLANFT